MRMVPPQPPRAATGSELDLFHLLEQVEAGEGALVFTSLNLSEHEYKKWGEIDFVVLMPEGLIALEVKGGQVHCDSRGIWRYESRGHRTIERAESPMAQVSSAYFSLRDKHLYPAVGKALVDAAPSGFGVVLSKTTSKDAISRRLIGGTEMPPELVATRENVSDAASVSKMLSRFLRYWRQHHNRTPRRWSRDEMELLAAAMRPWFDRVVPLSLSAAKVREEQLSLTQDQYRILDFSDMGERLICTGGAGCGKTLLAVECLRREMAHDPLLITGTDALAAHLRASFVPDPSRVMSLSELRVRPARELGRYGCLIVDEGQQLTNANSFALLSSVLTGGIEGGRWRWFSDPNQVLRGSGYDTDAARLLESLAFPGVLRHNCRNTPQIVSTVEAVTGVRIGSENVRGQGPDVIFAPPAARDVQMRAAAKAIRCWLEDPEISSGEIVLLSTGPVSASSIPEIAGLVGRPFKQWTPGWTTAPEYKTALAAATVDDFRGIEAPFIVLCDVNTELAEPMKHLYLGMTRPNFGLFVMADQKVIGEAIAWSASVRQKK